jgi:hypothetical protein
MSNTFLSNEERLCRYMGTYEMFLDSGILHSLTYLRVCDVKESNNRI